MTLPQIMGLVLILLSLFAFGISTVAGAICLIIGIVLLVAGLNY